MKTTSCKGCGRPIGFVKTPAGKHLPVNPRPIYFEPDPKGDLWLVNYRGEIVRCYEIQPPGIYDPHTVGYMPHWPTCAAADRFKKQKDEKVAKQKEAATEKAKKEAAKRQLSFY